MKVRATWDLSPGNAAEHDTDHSQRAKFNYRHICLLSTFAPTNGPYQSFIN